MNAVLGNIGQTVFYTDQSSLSVNQTANIVELANEVDTGQVDLLIVWMKPVIDTGRS
jgi:hypothetical protein